VKSIFETIRMWLAIGRDVEKGPNPTFKPATQPHPQHDDICQRPSCGHVFWLHDDNAGLGGPGQACLVGSDNRHCPKFCSRWPE